MARLAGVDLPKNERVEIGLTRIYGIGRALSRQILDETGIDPNKRVKDLTNDDIAKIRALLDNKFKVEGELKKEISMNIKRLMEIGCYRGYRHKLGLPVRGQRTKTNSRTRKGPKRAVVKKKGGK
ncbi:MAG: 30S ribosomal protein S13 [Candidatus Magnetoovum sp. WYHC-5]|nr:30S ribosomal protein S13 [Candidatus Magnetoovum sp. WYHC-5]